ncbi:hypothetical protein C5F50_08665 [Nitrosopumilus ureiphilus]|uniref:Uncharacterized protein n=1 Tax=Nitrosopumilus ureiphilus TaxID=1470067 RepID=A0A7D5R6P9_9ARCH|nr:hypothetical protein C5F50_08665 [Nitrosopumilus ureiphilus]
MFLMGFLTSTAFAEISPREQIDNNVKPFAVVCNDELVQIFKVTSGFAVCVFPNSAEKLIERGWATYYATRAYMDDGKIVSNSIHHWQQIIKFELQRQNIEYAEPKGYENHRITDDQSLTPFKLCATLIDKDGNRFYPNFVVTDYDPIITEKVVFSKIHPNDCTKEFYSLGEKEN